MVTANGNGERKVNSLRELPRAIAPPQDLWSRIEAQIAEASPSGAGKQAVRRSRSWANPAKLRWMAAAAVVASLAVGVWIGRSLLPVPGKTTAPAPSVSLAGERSASAPEAIRAAYMTDPRYRTEREALMKSLEAKINSLPPNSRAKVVASLATIHQSMKDLEAALGKDPSNALLQELLVNTYQDEMRVLTDVHEASDAAGKGI